MNVKLMMIVNGESRTGKDETKNGWPSMITVGTVCIPSHKGQEAGMKGDGTLKCTVQYSTIITSSFLQRQQS